LYPTTHVGTGSNPKVGPPVSFSRPPPFSFVPSPSFSNTPPSASLSLPSSARACTSHPYEDTSLQASPILPSRKSEGTSANAFWRPTENLSLHLSHGLLPSPPWPLPPFSPPIQTRLSPLSSHTLPDPMPYLALPTRLTLTLTMCLMTRPPSLQRSAETRRIPHLCAPHLFSCAPHTFLAFSLVLIFGCCRFGSDPN
jgi:hypothetical protein